MSWMYSGICPGRMLAGSDRATVAGSLPSNSFHAGQGIARSGVCIRAANSS
jgi:hypothetical protein